MGFFPLLLILLLVISPAGASDYDFSIPQAHKKPFTLGGRMEGRYIYHSHNEDSLFLQLNAVPDDPEKDTHEGHGVAELSAGYGKGMLKANVLTHHEAAFLNDASASDHSIYEAFVSVTPDPRFTLDAGKKRILWGKGYAWNPVGFLNPAKDPDDPALNQEGRTYIGVDLIRSFASGPLTNMGVTALALPVIENWANTDMGENGDIHFAIKCYLLFYDTDIDGIYFDGPGKPRRVGIDFSKNLSENMEIHGEWAMDEDVARMVFDAAGNGVPTKEDAIRYLLGMRYLNTLDTTFILEYYHNGAGYDRGEVKNFFRFQENALALWQSGGDESQIQRAIALTRPYSGQRNYGRDYLYLKISQKEPFDILYFTPWAGGVMNLNDGSLSILPGLTWTPLTDLEINFRVGIPVGAANTEFGEKTDAFRPEFWVRYYF
jgi:hypothetical protein